MAVAGVLETPSPLANDGVLLMNGEPELVPQIGGEGVASVAGNEMQSQLDRLEAELTSAMDQLNIWYPNQSPATRWPCGDALTRRLRNQVGFWHEYPMLRQYWENRLRLLDLFNQHCDPSTVRWVDLFWTRWAAPKLQYPFPYLFQRLIEGLYNAEADCAVQVFMAIHYLKLQVRDATGLVLISLAQCDGPYFPSETNREQLAWVMLEQFDSLSAKSVMVATHLHVHTHGEWQERVTTGWYAEQASWINRLLEEYTAYLVERKRADANFFSLTDPRED